MNENNYLLNYLDKPVKLLMFTMGEMFAVILPFLFGMYFSHVFLGILGGFMALWGFRFFRIHFNQVNFMQCLYWYLPTQKKMYQIYIPSYVREWH